MKQPIHILMLGGGYVTVCAYQALVNRLSAQLADGRVVLTVICPNTHHVFHGWTAETLTGILQEKHQLSPLAALMPRAGLLNGKVTALHTDLNEVAVELPNGSQQRVAYDHLLLGIGSFDSEAVTGIRSHGYQVKDRDAFQRTKAAIPHLVRQAAETDSATAQKLLTFSVAGGGFTGVELATNIMEYVTVLKNQYVSLQAITPVVRLIHSGERVLPSLQANYDRLVRYAEKTMRRYGIEVIKNRRITNVTDDGVFLDDNSFVASRMVISTVGQSRCQLTGTETMLHDDQQRLFTNTFQQISGQTNVWGGGDACAVMPPKTGEACPANALWAIKHGLYAGRNIARAVKGQALKPFSYPGLGQSASLGMGKGITELYGIQFTGLLAWLMRWFFFQYFMPSRRVMFQGLGDWFFLMTRGERIGVRRAREHDVQLSKLVATQLQTWFSPEPVI